MRKESIDLDDTGRSRDSSKHFDATNGVSSSNNELTNDIMMTTKPNAHRSTSTASLLYFQ